MLEDIFAEEVEGGVGLEAEDDTPGKPEGELAVFEIGGGGGGVVEPLEVVAPGEEELVEGAEEVGVGTTAGGGGWAG